MPVRTWTWAVEKMENIMGRVDKEMGRREELVRVWCLKTEMPFGFLMEKAIEH